MRQCLTHLRRIPWHIVARVVLFLGLIIPGAILIADRSGWVHAGALGAVGHVMPIYVFGAVMIVGAILILFERTREWGYLIGAICWAILGLGYLGTLLAGTAISPLGAGYPVTVSAYLTAVGDAIKSRIHGEEGDDDE